MPALSVGFAKQGSSRGSTHVVALPCSSHALFLPPFFFGGGRSRAAQRLCFEVGNGFSHPSAALGKGETHKELCEDPKDGASPPASQYREFPMGSFAFSHCRC